MSAGELFAEKFLAEAAEIVARLDRASLEKAARMIGDLRATGGRLFILGVGGSAGECIARGERFPEDCGDRSVCADG